MGDAFFQPLRIGSLEISGRLIKTATSETRAAADGSCTDLVRAFYEPMAEGGVPLVITGNIFVSRDGQSTVNQMGADSDDRIAGLAVLTQAVQRHGTKIFAQLSHAGRQVVPAGIGRSEAVAPSSVLDLAIGTKPRALARTEIRRIVADFGAAARRCKAAGFDGVQIHAGHGYLISQFLTPYTNRRTDAYGGALDNRLRFLREVHDSIRAEVGPDFPVILKLNGSDSLPLRRGLKTAELVEIAEAMERAGIDGVEVSVGHYESGFPVVRGTFWRCLRGMAGGGARNLPFLWRQGIRLFWPAMALFSNLAWPHREGFNLAFAREFKRALRVPVICVGGFRSRAAIEAALTEGACDAVSAGRAFIANPHLARHLREGTSGPACVFCNACVGQIGTLPLDCFHPEVRRQKDTMLAELAQAQAAEASRPAA